MTYPTGPGYYKAEPAYADRLRAAGLVDAQSVFDLPAIEVWRSITERENCVLDDAGGRLHIKRNKKGYSGAADEAAKLQLLKRANVPSVPLAGYGKLNDGRGFLITDDLAGYEDAEVLVKADLAAFERLLKPTAALAAKLHAAGLHHRDLYLCHFYVKSGNGGFDVRLMDAGRVAQWPRWLKRRWLIKDLAQFGFSLSRLELEGDVFDRWLAEYGLLVGTAIPAKFDVALRRDIARKIAWIGRHDAKLRARQPTRNVAIDR